MLYLGKVCPYIKTNLARDRFDAFMRKDIYDWVNRTQAMSWITSIYLLSIKLGDSVYSL